jgi:hypothetical protein
MSKSTKRQVRYTTAFVKNPLTGETDALVRASTKLGNKTITVQEGNEETANARLAVKIRRAIQIAEFKAEYPKTVEVDLGV